MERLSSLVGLLLLSFAIAPEAQATMPQPLNRLLAQGAVETMSVPPVENLRFETYLNERFSFSIQYPSRLLIPQSPPTNLDGRLFISPERDVRMAVYGRPQVDKSLEEFHRSLLQSHAQRGSEVMYEALGDKEFVVSGYTPSGNAFYQKVLLRDENFLILSLNYEQALQSEFAPVVEAIARSFQGANDQPTATDNQVSYERPSRYRQIQIYFPEADEEIIAAVESVSRTTNRPDVVEYALEQLIQGPTTAEQDEVDPLPIQFVGESICGDRNFILEKVEGVAIVQFCRDVIRGGLGDDADFERSFQATLTQFATITEVVLLDQAGTCLIDFRGNNDCLSRLPESFQESGL